MNGPGVLYVPVNPTQFAMPGFTGEIRQMEQYGRTSQLMQIMEEIDRNTVYRNISLDTVSPRPAETNERLVCETDRYALVFNPQGHCGRTTGRYELRSKLTAHQLTVALKDPYVRTTGTVTPEVNLWLESHQPIDNTTL